MAEDDAPSAESKGPGRLDEFPFSQTEDFTTDDPRRAGPLGEAQDRHDQEDRLCIEKRDDGDEKHETRKGNHHVDEAHHNRVDPSAEVARHRPQQSAYGDTDPHRHETDREGDPCAIHQA